MVFYNIMGAITKDPKGQPKYMDQEVGRALFHHLGRDLTLPLRQLLHLVRGQGDHVRDAGHGGSHGQWQAQNSADGESQCSAHEQVQMISWRKKFWRIAGCRALVIPG